MPPGILLIVRWAFAGFFALAVVALGLSVLRFRDARRAPYYFLREASRRAGTRWLLVAFVMVLLGTGALYVRAHPPASLVPPTVTASPTPTEVMPSPTPMPSPTFTATPVPPTPTSAPVPVSPTPTVTPTPAYPLPETALSPLPGATPARPEARITLWTFALGEENGQPVQPSSSFPAGDFRVYAFIRYEGMSRGVQWTYGWYREGKYLDGNTCLWWVRMPDCPYMIGERGSTYLYYRRPGGYDPGTYEVRIWIEDRFQGAFPFTIVP
ncbi:MAG: hypothetical protein D6793_01655 [Thermoflexia bacterium]|nr:MAG: hypothetical protein D6793_01655 [Thermoflexia bacterium]